MFRPTFCVLQSKCIFTPTDHFKMLTWYIFITFSILIHFYIVCCLDTDAGMQNGDEASSSISLAGQGQLVKMLITLEPHGTMNILIKCLHFNIGWPLVYAKWGRSFVENFDRRPRHPHNCPRLPQSTFTVGCARYCLVISITVKPV